MSEETMSFCIVASPDARFLSATDILVGDMSDTNYEFLLFDRPLILLANDWLRENFADVGIKSDLDGLESAVDRSLLKPEEYKEARREWLYKTIHFPFDNASARVLTSAIERSTYQNPTIVIIHGNSEVRKTNLAPLYEEAVKQGLKADFVPSASRFQYPKMILFAAHFEDLKGGTGFKVHLDHGLKGKGTANVEMSRQDYIKHAYFPYIDLHITAGQVGDERSRMLLGPFADRTLICGYPKADHLNLYNTAENRQRVCKKLGFNPSKPILAYAPAGEYSYEKPGGSLSPFVLGRLDAIGKKKDINVLIKLKQKKVNIGARILRRLRRYAGF